MMALPQTPFEQQGLIPPFTSHAAEATYIDALLAQVPAIQQEQVGQGTLGDPIYLYKIGTGPRRAFIVAFQHATEPLPREATLTLLRDLATDPTMTAYLAQVTVMIMPTARPDGQWTRENPNGININRDHVRVTQDETKAIQQVITTYEPDLIVDVHEGANITETFATSKVLNQNTHADLLALSDNIEQAVKAKLEAETWTWEPYQNHNIYGPEYFSSNTGVRHAVGLLLESRRYRTHDDDTADRYTTQRIALGALLDWHSANVDAVASACAASRLSTRSTVRLVTGTGSNGPVVPAPSGYIITPADELALARPIDIFNLTVTDRDGDRFLDATGDAAVLVHYLANTASAQRLVEGAPVFDRGDSPAPLTPAEHPYPHFYVHRQGRNAPAAVHGRTP